MGTNQADEYRTARELFEEFGLQRQLKRRKRRRPKRKPGARRRSPYTALLGFVKKLGKWCRNGIAALDLKKLKRFTGAPPYRYHRPTVAAAYSAAEDARDGRWATDDELAKELGVDRRTVRQWADEGFAHLNYQKLPCRRAPVKRWMRDGVIDNRRRRQFDRAFALKAFAKEPRPVGSLTVREAATKWGVSTHSVRYAIADGRLTAVPGRAATKGLPIITYIQAPPATFPRGLKATAGANGQADATVTQGNGASPPAVNGGTAGQRPKLSANKAIVARNDWLLTLRNMPLPNPAILRMLLAEAPKHKWPLFRSVGHMNREIKEHAEARGITLVRRNPGAPRKE